MKSNKSRKIFSKSCFDVNSLKLLGTLAISILLVSGCATVGPDYVKPSTPEPKAWLQEKEPKIESEGADFSQWWTIFDDAILNNLIQAASQQNLPLRISGVRIMEARAQLGIAVGNRYPQLQQLGANYTRVNLSENAANTAVADHAYGEYEIGFDAVWELDLWGKFRRGIESSIAGLEASIAGYDDALVSLTAEVARTYVIIRTLEGRLAIARENVKIQEQSLKIAQVRFDGGVVTELDVQQAKALLRNTQALIPQLESDLRQAKNGLAILLGALPGDIDGMLGVAQSIPAPPAEVAVGIPAELLRRRPDIRFAEFQVAVQSARVGIVKADLFPHFSLLGSIGLRTGDSACALTRGNNIGDLFEAKSIEYFTGPSLRWDILNYGRITNRVRVEDARLQELIVNYQNTVLRSTQEAEDSMVAFVRSEEESVFLKESVEASKRSVDLALIQYREGLVDYQRVLDTQRSLTQQQDRFTAMKGSVTLNLIALYKALGGGWQIRFGKGFVPEETKEEMRKRTNWGELLSEKRLKNN